MKNYFICFLKNNSCENFSRKCNNINEIFGTMIVFKNVDESGAQITLGVIPKDNILKIVNIVIEDTTQEQEGGE